jgi:hypothetical protein
MWPSLLKIQYTELKLSCGKIRCMLIVFLRPSRDGPYYVIGYDGRVGVHTGFRTITLVLCIGSCGNDPVVKKYIYSNGDLDLWHNDPKINRFLPLLQGNHVAKFAKDPIYRTKVIVRKRPCYYVIGYDGRVGVHTGFRTITLVLCIGSLPNLTTWFPCRRGRILFILGSLDQRSSNKY